MPSINQQYRGFHFGFSIQFVPYNVLKIISISFCIVWLEQLGKGKKEHLSRLLNGWDPNRVR